MLYPSERQKIRIESWGCEESERDIHIYMYIHTYLQTYKHTDRQTIIHTYIHAIMQPHTMIQPICVHVLFSQQMCLSSFTIEQMRSFQHVTLACTPRMSCCTQTRMSCCSRKWGTEHNASCHSHQCVMPHTWMSHVTHMNESCHTHGWDVAHTGMSQVTHTNNQRKRKGGCKKRRCQASTSPSRTTIIHSMST